MPQQTTENISIDIGGTSTSSNANFMDAFHDNDEDVANVDVVLKSKISLMCTLPPQRYASSISRHPATNLTVSLLLSITLSIIVFTKGNLHFDAPSIGWFSKGTTIANRAAQEQLVRDIIFREEGGRLEDGDEDEELYCSGEWYESDKLLDTNELNLVSFWKIPDLSESEKSALDADALYEMCLKEEYTLNLLSANDLCHKCSIGEEERCIQPFSLVGFARLFLLFQWNLGDQFELGTKHLLPSISCGELRDEWSKMVQRRFEEVMLECTNYLLENNQFKPASNEDYSKCENFPIMTASLVDGQFIETGRVKYTTSIFATKNDPASIKSMYYGDKANQFRSPPSLNFNGRSSFEDELYEVGMNSLYLTPKQGFYELYLSERLPLEVAIGAASLLIAAICVLMHTSSPFLTVLGLVQILLTLPVGYFVYYFICRVSFFPFLNVNSIFILFAVGVDDIFVVVDTWRTFRLELPPHSTTEQVAVYALPKIAFNTFVTSVTTAAAFFASAGIKIPVVASFVIFSGLLVTMDYVLSILIMFPALCMYDNWLTQGCKSRWLSLSVSKDSQAVASIESNPTIETSIDEEEQQERDDCRESKSDVDMKDLEVFDDSAEHNAIEVATKSQLTLPQTTPSHDQALTPPLQKDEAKGLEITDKFTIILHSIYKVVHLLRWPLLLVSFAAVIVSSIVASQIKSADQLSEPILPSTNRYERHRQWSSKLLAYKLLEKREVLFIWGSTPTDTSRRIDPNQSSNLVFDESFDPSTESAQVFLLEQCEDVYSNNKNHTFFRQYPSENNESGCILQRFNVWLKRESQSTNPTKTYINNCFGESGIPVSPEIFHSCFIAYSNSYALSVSGIFHDEGIVKLFAFTGRTQTSFISPLEEQDNELKNIEAWREEGREAAPDETRNFFFSSFGFHVTDSLKNMVSSARGAIGIATACASLMILLTTRSLMVTVLSAISVGYVFVSTTACLVGLGWTLGVFESILLAISVGIGSDYVLHVSHSYSMTPNNCFTREERTRYAVVHIGRPIIGSAVTTLATAIMMMFSENQFSRRFATLLIVTIFQALIGSFVVFVTLCDCFGPSAKAKSNKCGGRRLQTAESASAAAPASEQHPE